MFYFQYQKYLVDFSLSQKNLAQLPKLVSLSVDNLKPSSIISRFGDGVSDQIDPLFDPNIVTHYSLPTFQQIIRDFILNSDKVFDELPEILIIGILNFLHLITALLLGCIWYSIFLITLQLISTVVYCRIVQRKFVDNFESEYRKSLEQ